jgi:hypothetical protein
MSFQAGNTFGRHPNPNGGRKPRFDEEQLDRIFSRGWPIKDRVEAVRQLALKANQGDVQAAALLLSYCYGKPRQMVEIEAQLEVGKIETWEDVREECEKLGIDPRMARDQAMRLLESVEFEDDDEGVDE